MKVRIKKRDLVRDGLSPWSDDCLGRRSLEDCLENLVKNAFDPLVVAVNGTWGSGKSYFLYNWYLDLENHYKDCEGTLPTLYFNLQHNGDNQPLHDLEQWRFIRGANANVELSSAHRFVSALENGQMTKVITTSHDMIAGTNGLDRVDADVVKSLAERLDCFKL